MMILRNLLIKILSWNISVESEIEIDKVIHHLEGLISRPTELISNLQTMKERGKKNVDRYDVIKALERL